MRTRLWLSLGVLLGMLCGLPVIRAQVVNPGVTIARIAGGTLAANFLTLSQAGKSITLSGNLTTTGAFNPTFAIPSSSTWAFPSGGGTLLSTVGSGTSLTFPGTLVIASGKTLTVNNTLTLAGTDGVVMTTPTTSFTVARTDAGQTFTGQQTFSTGITIGTSGNLFGGTNTIEIRNGAATAQTLNTYNTINGSDYERGAITWGVNSNEFWIGTQKGGTGTVRPIRISNGSASALYMYIDSSILFGGSTNFWQISAGGDFLGLTAAGKLGIGGASGSYIYGDAANTLAQRNGAAAQTSRLYETYTDASNYSRLSISAPSGGPITFASEAAGTGTARTMSFTGGSTYTFSALLKGTYLQGTTVYSAAGTALPTCNGTAEGSRAAVSDATLPAFLTAYTSGGAVHASVYCDGTSWKTD